MDLRSSQRSTLNKAVTEHRSVTQSPQSFDHALSQVKRQAKGKKNSQFLRNNFLTISESAFEEEPNAQEIEIGKEDDEEFERAPEQRMPVQTNSVDSLSINEATE